MTNSDNTLLLTKLHRPAITRDLLDRPILFKQLNNGITRPLTLVLASAGFGKSTLVSAWLENMTAGRFADVTPYPAAWLSLDENDSDLSVFILYLITALRTMFADACEKTLTLVQSRLEQPPALLYATLSNDIEQIPEDFILVLDDYHTIRGMEVQELLNTWVRHWPKPLHMVLISRISPPLAVSHLRAKGGINEIRTRQLRFTSEETVTYLSQASNAILSNHDVNIITERFEGWPAGLHLAALSLRSQDTLDTILAAFAQENVDITEYLVEEVLLQQFPAIQSFLLKTSILERFCPFLCEAIVGDIEAAWTARACLDWIERSELFLIPLDNHREWYRYHHLFQELLQRRLSAVMTPDQIKQLHLSASAWFEKQGLLDEALQHALAAGDFDVAARQMTAGLCEVLNRQDRITLDRWQRLLPEEMFQQQPELMMIRVWSLEFQWRLDLQFQLLQKVEDMLASGAGETISADNLKLLQGQIFGLRAQHAYFSNQPVRAIDLCQQALALLPSSWEFLRGGATLFLGLSMQANGQTQAAERLLHNEYERYGEKTDAYALEILESLGFIYINSGNLDDASRIARTLVQSGASGGLKLIKNWGNYYLGVAHFERNELELAAQYFFKVIEDRFTSQLAAYHDSVAGLAVIQQLTGKSDAAWQLVEGLSRFDLEQTGREDEQMRSVRAWLMLMQGDMEGAGRWVDSVTGLPHDVSMIWLEEPQLTRVSILVSRGSDADLRLALQVLDSLDEIANRTHNTRCKIRILILRAWAKDALGDTRAATADLRQALALSSMGGFIRRYVDAGNPMQKMLQQLAKQERGGMIAHILAAFPAQEQDQAEGEILIAAAHHPTAVNAGLVEPLSTREVEILNLLRGPSSIKEIALKLGISHATAKRHTINLYAKLGVNKRWSAVAKAEELHILPPP